MKFDKYFVNGFDNFLITTFLIVIVYIIIYLSINKKIEAFNKTRPNHAVSIPFVSSAVRVAYFLLSFVIIAYQILPFRPVLDLMMDASGILAICVTFAARESFSNYIAGFLLTIHKPFIIGDKISIQDPKIKGIVKRKGKKARKSNRKKRRRKIKTAFINVFGENIYKKIRGK